MPRRVMSAIALTLVVLLVLGVAGWFGGPKVLYATGLWSDGGSPTIDPSLYAPTPAPTPTVVTPIPVAVAATQGRLPDGATLLARLNAVDRATVGRAGMVVIDPLTGAAVTGQSADALMTPASTLKLLTSAAALAVYGPDHRFTTKVVAGTGSQIVLVGGGDPYLRGAATANYPERASIADLADSTADALKTSGRTSVALAFDESLFSGAGWNPAWPANYHGDATPTSALWVDEGVTGLTHSLNPTGEAANAFAAQLTARGIQVTSVAAGTAPAGATQLAAVQSLPLDLIVSELLLHSDNDATEVLFRQVALAAGRSGSIADAQVAVPAKLAELGLWTDGMKMDDGSGLSRGNLATAAVLAKALAKGFTDPRYRALLDGLPTAAAIGTLHARFDDIPTEGAGRGAVRAKTGTLTGVHSLAGFTRTADGGLVVFAFIANDVPADGALAARDWLERTSSVVAACGC